MNRILYDDYFLTEPTKENFEKLKRELDIALENGLIYPHDYKKILEDREKRIKDVE